MDTPAILSRKIEALLFTEGGSLAKKKLLQILNISPEILAPALVALKEMKQGTGLTLVEADQEVTLAVAPEVSTTVRNAFERELGREIGDAGLEVLAIVLYRGPSTRARIDYIRGVNTSSTIRLLTARGLLERTLNPDDAREYLYRPTVELLAHIGVSNKHELPEYAKIVNELAAFEESNSPFQNHASIAESGSEK